MHRLTIALLASLITATAVAQTLTLFRVDRVAGGIAAGPDGNVWFPTGFGIVRMTPDGAMTTFAAPSKYGQMITAGGDGRMWFTSRAIASARFQ